MASLDTKCALVVEDDPDTRAFVSALLSKAGCEVLQAADGDEARAQAAQRVPDFVCLDLMLPATGGLKVCADFKADPVMRDVPILIISGRTGVDDRAYAMEAGASHFLEKPFRTREFMAAVGELLDGRNDCAPLRSEAR